MSTSERRTGRKHHTLRRNHPLLSWYALFFLLCLLLLPTPAHAQEPGPTTLEWRTFTAENSPLAPGDVWEFLEDSQGRIWVRTDGGLSLYQDGAWQTFTTEVSPLRRGWFINALLEDSQGHIWVRTVGGLSLYQDGAWQTFTAENSPLAPGDVQQVLEDSQGHIWVGTSYYDSETGTYRGGVSLYQDGAWQTFTAENSALASGNVWELLEDSQGHIWVHTNEGLGLYQDGAWRTFTAENSALAPGNVRELLEDSQGHIWVRTDEGLGLYQDGTWQTFTAENSPLAPGDVQELLEDSQGRIWVGTDYYDSEMGTYRGGVSLYQDGAWQTFTAENSALAPGNVWELLEDSQGRIWVRTDEGLGLYQDGAWQTFTAKNLPLASGRITQILEDSQGRVWVGTWEGLGLYQDGIWQTFTAENSPLAPDEVQKLLEDSQGRIWVETQGGLGLYQDRAWQTLTKYKSLLVPSDIRELLEDSQGRIWVHTGNYSKNTDTYRGWVSLYQDGAWQAFTVDNSPLAPGEVRELLEDSKGRIWVGTSWGVSLYQATAWQAFTTENSPIAPGKVSELLEDSQGRIWVRTDEGLSLYQDGAWQTFTAENSALAPGETRELLEDSQGHIWVGTGYYDSETGTSRGGVSLYQGGAWQTFTAENSALAPGNVWELLEDSQGHIWVGTGYYDSETGTYRGGVSLYQDGAWQTFTAENSPLAPGDVQEVLEDSQGRIWVRTDEGLGLYQDGAWRTFTAENSPLAPGDVRELLEDSQGRIWVGTFYYDSETGTAKGGVSLYQDEAWQTFTPENSPLAPGDVWELLEDSQGRIWVGTFYYDSDMGIYRGGVSLYQNGAWQTLTSNTLPLAPGPVVELLEDSQGRIWIGTGCRHDHPSIQRCTALRSSHRDSITLYREDAWQTFTAENSPMAPGGVTQILEDSQGYIWVGTYEGLSMHHPSSDQPCAFLRYASLAPGQTTSLRATAALTFTFPSPRSTLEVDFSGIDAESDLDRLLFRCQLVGYDDEEVPCASPVRYAALPPGTYTFRVRALDEDLMSSEPATATFTLISTAPPTPPPTPQVIERVVPGLPKEAVIPLIGGLGGLVVAIVLGAMIWSRVRRARRLAAWRKGADPYVVGAVIAEPEQFYGREEALTELLRALEAGNHVALYGERRIGKTSLLYQLAHRLRDLSHPDIYFLPVFVNLQMIPEPRFFSALAGAIAKATRRALEQHGQDLPSLQFDGRLSGYDSFNLVDDLEAIVEALQEATGRQPCIALLLDEADKMNEYEPHTQEALRGLLMTPIGGHVKLVWSGQTMNREWHLESSPWYNLFKQEIHLGGLKKEPAGRLIREPVKEVFTYDDEAVQRILQLTGYKPYPIQRLSSFCIRRLLGENRFRATIDDVETAWRDLQAEDARRAAEGATDLTYEPPRPAWTVAEEGTQYHTDEEKEP